MILNTRASAHHEEIDSVANVHLEKSFCVKYLGVYIDCHLTWHDHIDYICGKIRKKYKYNG